MFAARLWPLVGFALVACEGAQDLEMVVQRDSAGIHIVESLQPQWSDGEAWTISAEPLMDLAAAGSGPDYEFFRIRNAIRLDDGRIAVANSGTNELRVYDATGRYLRSSGRTGQGPGEFERLTSVRKYRGDSLMAFDYWGRRISVLDAAGEIARVTPLPALGGSFRNLYTLPQGAFLLHALTLSVMEEVRGRVRLPAPLLRLGPEGTLVDTVATVPGYETFVFEMGDVGPPFFHETWIAVHDSLIYVGEGATFEIKIMDVRGELQRIIRLPDYDLSVPETVRDSIRAALLQAEVPAEVRPTFRDMANSIPERRPAYSGILVDPLGFMWVQGYIRSLVAPGPRRSEVFDPSGQWLGTVELPSNFNLYEVGEDYLLGRLRDDLGVETIQLLALDRS